MQLTVNDLSFHVVDEGAGQPVLLLHGFPDSSALWRHQVPALVAAGHRVIAPDLRGFGESDRPEGVASYAMPVLVSDVLGILDALELPTAGVVGHDWGAGLAWTLAGVAPERVDRLVALSVGYPAGYLNSMRQREQSWYMLFFQFTGVAEKALSHNDFAMLRTWMPDAVDLERYVADLGRPGALTAALNWYRANIPPESFAPEAFGTPDQPMLPPPSCSVLGIWSDGDPACGEEQMTASEQYVTGPWSYARITGAGHWIPLDAPDTLNKLLLEFL
jgi:pimeloyl-ACP methyl ester carboxylesterase